MVILPSSVTGSPRHMHEYSQDAMTYVRHFGRPDLFITFTCNSSWREIQENLLPGQTPVDRHDLIARVFKQKLTKLMGVICKGNIFGETQCWLYSIEWQKRGLPHAHILFWLKEKIHSTDVDKVISAELPDPTADPLLHELVTKNMMHGPCGKLNRNSPCMVDGKCTKRYPRASIKYVLKYVHKGSDQAVFQVQKEKKMMDEVEAFQLGRYISSNEAVWRILGMPIHERYPTVVHLSVHLENGQRVYFNVDNFRPENLLEPPRTTLTAFFVLCQNDDFAKTLLYCDVPKYYTWQTSGKTWQRRKQGIPVKGHPGIRASDVLGRVYTIHPSTEACFHLRILLHVVKGPTSYNALKTVNGHLFATFREACQERGLLENDQHWDLALSEAGASQSPHR